MGKKEGKMVEIEVPEETRSRFPTGTGFPLIFNGDVITHQLSG